jgi:hypothetical protein
VAGRAAACRKCTTAARAGPLPGRHACGCMCGVSSGAHPLHTCAHPRACSTGTLVRLGEQPASTRSGFDCLPSGGCAWGAMSAGGSGAVRPRGRRQSPACTHRANTTGCSAAPPHPSTQPHHAHAILAQHNITRHRLPDAGRGPGGWLGPRPHRGGAQPAPPSPPPLHTHTHTTTTHTHTHTRTFTCAHVRARATAARWVLASAPLTPPVAPPGGGGGAARRAEGAGLHLSCP